MAFTRPDLGDSLPLIASGKVRELYNVDSKSLLFVASDRISAYDVIMENGIPDKGLVLTLITAHWFQCLQKQIPDLKTHFLSLELPPAVPENQKSQLKGRSMLVRKLKVFPVEAIVRGYITGSAWSSYQKTGEVNGKKMPEGLEESQELPEPIYTPSTKAELGQHDENISTEQAATIVGEKYAKRIEELSLTIYKAARDYAKEKGIIIADTKFEFGLDEETDEVVLVDEVLTPDSSRFWSKSTYKVGQGQDSFDKQFLRDWLTENGLKGREGVSMPQDVVEATRAKYLEAFKILTGKSLQDTLQELK
ncbi:Bifunctional purine biosynthetic protein ade1 [Exophiala xenobiotica]|nr:Bifunctional purine biosynthetic protein ade1 [Exophiala xenobiotica]KAK5249582.1 Bifunctional purine biosynthetic protein ade1 [Exophiala xenobiotica]KAK5354233.1 Bifunctional purine biosynthetic protein ade1 [Exophiala xenobiotica]KAK5358903.1 Bifunctional purine biosynthetic protein ade1 [Exophiala xenobiotica]KAK5371945.1 Bifunctional purine biosynthetic protein ade1 [Exophiala xenobiotica]